RHRRWEEPNLAVLMAIVPGAERLQVGSRVIRAEVHLPVGGEQQPPHASSRAATPGRGFPSRNSSDAPPPVETWLSLSSSPATAAAESPPPTPRGRISLAPALARSPLARSSLSRSTRDPPT